MTHKLPKGLAQLEHDITTCERCPRLRDYCQEVARVKRRAYLDWDYWGRPVPGFGDPHAQLFILGLAPGAHGANRTGRVFTGDRSGDWLYRALHQTGFANQPTSDHRDDGLQLTNAWVSASVRCAPPDNKPLPPEIVTCRDYLDRELALMRNVRVVVALGRLAFDNYLGKRRSKFEFTHDGELHVDPGAPILISSYHPSQQNTSTGKLTEPMLRAVFERARRLLA
ncbi:uracil-DNA glycosylase [uncultured Paludibaculum sp.]|uniref:uracil-DNA glycosylase n=1 Tax=uncultured Paludibaculum sp. TaxID=1765020 RepID=UPI002AABABBF|nr:uracil-DNA glycosylase [uncultured Paludibaculum sp.]